VEHPDYSRRLARVQRFDQFQKSLNIAPNMLTRRLSALVDAGLLQRRRYSERPPRHEYILTEWAVIFGLSSARCSLLSVFFLEPTYATSRIEDTLLSSEERMRRR
jgi:HxlR-like helix-turn-helix